MIIREAIVGDIQQIQVIRNLVTENTLSNPNLVTDEDCKEFMFERGKGWVAEINSSIVGFAIADLMENNIWALFMHPDFEKKGIGKQLHNSMLDWYFNQTKNIVWLGTEPNTRAEQFYKKNGWTEIGKNGSKEIKLQMTYEDWQKLKASKHSSK